MREIRFIDGSNPKLLKKALSIVRDVFWEFEATEYEDEGIMEFSDYIVYDNILRMMEDGSMVMLGCFENKRLAGVLALVSPGHVSLLFVAKAYHRRGIARNLMDETVRCVQHLSAADQLTVNSSPYAVPVYQKLGFTPVGPEQTLNGIRFTPMVRPLTQAAE